MFDIYFSTDYPNSPPKVLITTTGHFLDELLHFPDHSLYPVLIAGLPDRIPPKARGISAIPPIFDGCGHS